MNYCLFYPWKAGNRKSLLTDKIIKMKKALIVAITIAFLFIQSSLIAQAKKSKPRYDTIIRLHVDKPIKKQVSRPQEIPLPVPEFINQPCYFDKMDNKLIKLENANAQLITKKKTLGLKGARQSLIMEEPSSKIRFTAKKEIIFFIKTSGDVIDLTSYIKLYKFMTADEKREVTINAKEGMLSDKDEQKGKLVSFSVKMISKDNYMIQLAEQLEAGEYGFVWVKNMELTEFNVFAFAIDWKTSD